METNSLLKKVRKIEIKTKGLSTHIFAGEYHTIFKGKGMAFSEVRQYQAGDDIRKIDWNVTARYNSPFVKVFEEEREITVILLIDVSASGNFGTNQQFKKELASEIAGILSFSAIKNNDKVGVIFFSEKVEKFIPPKKGKKHILRIIRELIAFRPKYKGTNIATALRHFNSIIKKRSICFILSDFISKDFEKPLRIASKKHDLIALKITDPRELEIQNIGLIPILDAETQKNIFLDTSNKKIRDFYCKNKKMDDEKLKNLFLKLGVDMVDISTNKDYVKPLINFFKSREKK